MNARLPVELRSGLIAEILAWFIRCNASTGQLVEPVQDSAIGACLPWRWRELASAVRAASYRTPYSNIADYMDRFWFLPELFGERARLHRTMRSDRGRDLHDHPWHFVSIILEGGYTEEIEIQSGPNPLHETRRYRAGDILFRHAEHRHRLEVEDASECWSLVFTSSHVREWGFWTAHGFIPWREYPALEPA